MDMSRFLSEGRTATTPSCKEGIVGLSSGFGRCET